MIPILYESTESDFNTNGLGRLSDAISCVITEEKNGIFELAMEYPIEGVHFADLQNARLIKAAPGDGRADQLFSIYRIDKLIGGKAKVYAEHVSYRMAYIPVMPYTAQSAAGALAGLAANAVGTNPFTFVTDLQSDAEYVQEKPDNMRSMMFGAKGNIIEVYGGEVEFDNYLVSLKTQRGIDSGVTLRYGKNITNLSQENNITSTFTAIMPYVNVNDELITLPEKTVAAPTASNYPYLRVLNVDMAKEFADDEEVTVAALRQKAQEYIVKNNIGIPAVSITVSFVALWQTEEYKEVAPLERVNLCDMVTVVFEQLGVSAKAEVIKTTFNVLTERYNSIDIGDAKPTISSRATQEVDRKIDDAESFLLKAQKHATELITGGLGGYVVLKLNANGRPEELLIMDTDSIQTATNVWRFNKNGWGHSDTGYSGTYKTAATIDDGIVADFIKTGTLDATLVRAGTLADRKSNTTWDLENGNLVSKKLTIQSQYFELDNNGKITSKTADGRKMVFNMGSITGYKVSGEQSAKLEIGDGYFNIVGKLALNGVVGVSGATSFVKSIDYEESEIGYVGIKLVDSINSVDISGGGVSANFGYVSIGGLQISGNCVVDGKYGSFSGTAYSSGSTYVQGGYVTYVEPRASINRTSSAVNEFQPTLGRNVKYAKAISARTGTINSADGLIQTIT